jgi:uncharacterized protein (DUF2249 family)
MPEASPNERVISVAEIDPRYRHALPFRLFEHLAPDDSLQILVDHDPGPLRLQLEARAMARTAPGHIWRKARTSGAFVCASSALGVETIADLGRYDESGRCWGSGSLSRAERLEFISLVAALVMGECWAWIIPMLERGDPDED